MIFARPEAQGIVNDVRQLKAPQRSSISPWAETDIEKNVYILLTKREVRMAGNWPRSHLRFYGPRRSRGR